VPRVVEPARHRPASRRKPAALLAGGLTAVVALGAVVLVGLLRGGGATAPAPESLDRPVVPVLTTSAPVSRGPAQTRPAPVPAGPLRATPQRDRDRPAERRRDRLHRVRLY
jgi:hypothetical protein